MLEKFLADPIAITLVAIAAIQALIYIAMLRTFSIVSNQELPLKVGFKAPVTAADYQAAISGQRETFIFGRVRYRDQFQRFRTRYANFTFQFEHRPLPTDAPGTTGFGFNIAPKAYNDSN